MQGTGEEAGLRSLETIQVAVPSLALRIASVLLFACSASAADTARDARVAVLSSVYNTPPTPGLTAFRAELAQLGYVEGRNLKLDLVSAENRPERLPALAAEIVRSKPDVILTMGTAQSTVAAMKATTTIPIVFVHAGDPVAAGFVASLGRPGGNITGVTTLNADLGAKRLALLTEMVPSMRRVAVLVSAADAQTPSMLEGVRSAARAQRVQLDLLEIRDPADLDGAVSGAANARAGGLLVLGSPPLYRLSSSLAQLAIKHRLPTVSAWQEFVDAGGLASYGTDIPETFQRVARLVNRTLRGARPAELSVEQPTKFEFAVNLKTAKLLGLRVPESVMLQAGKIVR